MSRQPLTLRRKKSTASRLRVESLEDRSVPATIPVTPAVAPTAVDNDFTRLNAAIQGATAGDVIQLQGTFDWSETNARASWEAGSDGVAGNADDFYLIVPTGLNNVTLTATSLGAATIQGPGDLATFNQEGFLVFEGGDNRNWTISNLQIENFDLSIGFFSGTTHDAFDNTTITNNYIRFASDLNGEENPDDASQNIGIHLSFGSDQTISNNVIEIPGDGLSGPTSTDADLIANRAKFSSHVGIQSNSSGGDIYDGLQISGNTIRVVGAQSARPVRILGIWENSHSHLSDITISGNRFENTADANDPTKNRQQAFWLTAHSNVNSGTTVRYADNVVSGAAIGFKYLGDPEFPGLDYAANAGVTSIVLDGNTVTNAVTGLLVQSGGRALLTGNTFTGVAAGVGTGIDVLAGSVARLTGDNTVAGFATGVKVRGSATVVDSAVTGNGTGIDVDGGTALVQGSDLTGNSAVGLLIRNGAKVDAGQIGGADFTGLGISTGLNNFATYTATGAKAIRNLNTGPDFAGTGPNGAPFDVTAANNYFQLLSPTFVASTIEDDADNAALGFVGATDVRLLHDLAVTVTPIASPAYTGQNLTLLIQVTNQGPSEAPGVVLTSALPAGATFLFAGTDVGANPTVAGGILTAAVGTLAPGQTATVRVVLVLTTAGNLQLTATAAATGDELEASNDTGIGAVPVLATGQGVVKVAVVGGKLVLTGDVGANAVQVLPGATPNSYQVVGVGGTQVKFKTTTGTTAAVENVRSGISANLGGGSDTVILDGTGATPLTLGGSVTVIGAGENDTAYLLGATVSGSVLFNGGNGNDRLDVYGSTIGGSLSVLGGTGNDAVTVRASETAKGGTFNLGSGNDTTVLTGATFGGNVIWSGGSEDDEFVATGATFSKRVTLVGLSGADRIAAAGSSFVGKVTANGGTGADVLDATTAGGNTFDAGVQSVGIEDVVS